ncbi:MAG: GntR family transcriptional regulator, partial [Acidobacteriota bacterium]
MLNPQSPIPLYHQLSELILAKIRSGEYPAGSKIPSEHVLATQYSIGRPTVRQAVDLLVRKRLLDRRRGSGTFVSPRQEEVDLFSLGGTISSFHKKGISLETRILEGVRIVDVEGGPENPFSGGRAFFLSRLSLVEDTPVLLEEIYLHPECFPGLDSMELEGRSLSRIVDERYAMRPVSGRQNFSIGYVEEGRAR